MEKVGTDGVITVEESKLADTALDVVEGMQFDRGYRSPYFVTDPERMEVVFEDALVLIHEKKLSVMKDMLPLLEQVARAGKPLLIIAEDLEGEALATLVVDKLRGTLTCAAVKAPGFGDRRQAMLGDVATVTGGKALTEELDIKLENVKLEAPLRQIVENAGLEGSVIVEKVKLATANRGFDAAAMDYVDMLQAGIIDPTKVARVALQNAASIAALLLTTEVVISDLPEQDKAGGSPMPSGDMY